MVKRRTFNTRLIRANLSYSVQEIAELYGIHNNAVLRWIKNGLPVIDQSRPYLIYGADLESYLKKKQANRKHKCKPDEFFCFKCRLPRKAWGNMVDIEIRNENKLSLCGLCSACETIVRRAGSVKKLLEYQKIFTTQTILPPHITDCNPPSVMCDSRKDS